MMTLPSGFDVSVLVDDFIDFSLPFIEIAMLITAFVLIIKIFKRA